MPMFCGFLVLVGPIGWVRKNGRVIMRIAEYGAENRDELVALADAVLGEGFFRNPAEVGRSSNACVLCLGQGQPACRVHSMHPPWRKRK